MRLFLSYIQAVFKIVLFFFYSGGKIKGENWRGVKERQAFHNNMHELLFLLFSPMYVFYKKFIHLWRVRDVNKTRMALRWCNLRGKQNRWKKASDVTPRFFVIFKCY